MSEQSQPHPLQRAHKASVQGCSLVRKKTKRKKRFSLHPSQQSLKEEMIKAKDQQSRTTTFGLPSPYCISQPKPLKPSLGGVQQRVRKRSVGGHISPKCSIDSPTFTLSAVKSTSTLYLKGRNLALQTVHNKDCHGETDLRMEVKEESIGSWRGNVHQDLDMDMLKAACNSFIHRSVGMACNSADGDIETLGEELTTPLQARCGATLNNKCIVSGFPRISTPQAAIQGLNEGLNRFQTDGKKNVLPGVCRRQDRKQDRMFMEMSVVEPSGTNIHQHLMKKEGKSRIAPAHVNKDSVALQSRGRNLNNSQCKRRMAGNSRRTLIEDARRYRRKTLAQLFTLTAVLRTRLSASRGQVDEYTDTLTLKKSTMVKHTKNAIRPGKPRFLRDGNSMRPGCPPRRSPQGRGGHRLRGVPLSYGARPDLHQTENDVNLPRGDEATTEHVEAEKTCAKVQTSSHSVDECTPLTKPHLEHCRVCRGVTTSTHVLQCVIEKCVHVVCFLLSFMTVWSSTMCVLVDTSLEVMCHAGLAGQVHSLMPCQSWKKKAGKSLGQKQVLARRRSFYCLVSVLLLTTTTLAGLLVFGGLPDR